jgi:hypothetical protein
MSVIDGVTGRWRTAVIKAVAVRQVGTARECVRNVPGQWRYHIEGIVRVSSTGLGRCIHSIK